MKPNIVFILADDTGYGDPGCYNPTSLVPTPNIDRLAAEGTRFTDAHSPSALCTPTRYGILTGRYYWRTPKKHSLVMPYEPPVIEPDRETLPRMLGRAGYTSACVGKWHLGLDYRDRHGGLTQDEEKIDFTAPLSGGPLDCGFDYFFGTAGCSTSDPPYCFIENRQTVGVPTVRSGEELHALPGFYPGLMVPEWDEEEVDHRFVEEAIGFMRRTSAPFFLYLPISAPHNPWLPPEHAKAGSREGLRGDMNVLVDWCVGRIYDALCELGILDDTLLVFTSDNGPMRGENGQRSAGSLRGYKNTAFEGGHRIPLVVRWPDKVAAGAVSSRLVCLNDAMATFAALVGADVGPGVEDSHDVAAAGRPTLVSDTGGFASDTGDIAVRCGAWKLITLARDDDDAMAQRREPVPDAVDGRLLFNLEEDPSEERNVIEESPGIVAWLERMLEEIRLRGSRSVVPSPPSPDAYEEER